MKQKGGVMAYLYDNKWLVSVFILPLLVQSNRRHLEPQGLFHQQRSRPPHSATMTVYARVARTAGRTAVRAQRRQMGGSHAPAPEWTGIDKVVRGYFPEDYQREFYRRDAVTVCWRARRVEAGTKLRARPTEMTIGGSGGGWKKHAWLGEVNAVQRCHHYGRSKVGEAIDHQELKQARHVPLFRQSRWQPRRPRTCLDRVGHRQLFMALMIHRGNRIVVARRIRGKEMITTSVTF